MLHGGEWTTSRPGRFTPGKERGTHRIRGWVGSRTSLIVLEVVEGWKRVCRNSVNYNSVSVLFPFLQHAVLSILSSRVDPCQNTDLNFTVSVTTQQTKLAEVVKFLGLYSGRIRFESRPARRLSWPVFFVVFLRPSGRCLDSNWDTSCTVHFTTL
jgi:hypothetical protein